MGCWVSRSLAKITVALALLSWSLMSGAVGFGNANVMSALGQPLRAEIALVDVSDIAKKTTLTARLAAPEAFSAAGLDYPYALSGLKFEIETRRGAYFIKVTTKDPVNDPFVSLLVELSWPSGKMVHEYTFLLDPPDYKAEQPKAEEVKPIEPVVATPIATPSEEAAPAPAVVSETAASAPAAATEAGEEVHAIAETAPAEGAGQAEGMPAAIPAEPTPADMAGGAEKPAETSAAVPAREEKPVEPKEIVVGRGDTLSKIAERLREPDVTLEQMLVALYRANAGQFDGKNMNRIRAGKILRTPDASDLEHLSQRAAVNEIRIQTENWNAYRQKLATAGMPVIEQAPKQETSGKINTVVADKAPAVQQSSKEVLKLSKGEAPGDKMAAGAKATSAQDKAIAQQEEAIAKAKAEKEAQDRAAALEKQIAESKKLIELKGQGAAASAVVAPVAAASGVAVASGAVATQHKIAAPVVTPQEPESMLDGILAMIKDVVGDAVDPLYLAIALALVVLGGVGYFLMRLRNQGGGRIIKKKKMSPTPTSQSQGQKKSLSSLLSKLMPKKK